MNYLLIIAMTSNPLFPKTFTHTTFETMEKCEIALRMAKKKWATINDESKCVDLEKQKQIFEAEENLEKLRGLK